MYFSLFPFVRSRNSLLVTVAFRDPINSHGFAPPALEWIPLRRLGSILPSSLKVVACPPHAFLPELYRLTHLLSWLLTSPVFLCNVPSVTLSPGFNIHRVIKKRNFTDRLKSLQEGKNIDWATAEALAICKGEKLLSETGG